MGTMQGEGVCRGATTIDVDGADAEDVGAGLVVDLVVNRSTSVRRRFLKKIRGSVARTTADVAKCVSTFVASAGAWTEGLSG